MTNRVEVTDLNSPDKDGNVPDQNLFEGTIVNSKTKNMYVITGATFDVEDQVWKYKYYAFGNRYLEYSRSVKGFFENNSEGNPRFLSIDCFSKQERRSIIEMNNRRVHK